LPKHPRRLIVPEGFLVWVSGQTNPQSQDRAAEKLSWLASRKGKAELGLSYVGFLSMAEHRFRVGDLVRVQVSISQQPNAGTANVVALNRSSGIHEVTRLLPTQSGAEPLYQVRGSGGQRERVVRESELIAAVHSPQPRC
jgi:hypothetical protein